MLLLWFVGCFSNWDLVEGEDFADGCIAIQYYADSDGDGFGDPDQPDPVLKCLPNAGQTDNALDCCDAAPCVGAAEPAQIGAILDGTCPEDLGADIKAWTAPAQFEEYVAVFGGPTVTALEAEAICREWTGSDYGLAVLDTLAKQTQVGEQLAGLPPSYFWVDIAVDAPSVDGSYTVDQSCNNDWVTDPDAWSWPVPGPLPAFCEGNEPTLQDYSQRPPGDCRTLPDHIDASVGHRLALSNAFDNDCVDIPRDGGQVVETAYFVCGRPLGGPAGSGGAAAPTEAAE